MTVGLADLHINECWLLLEEFIEKEEEINTATDIQSVGGKELIIVLLKNNKLYCRMMNVISQFDTF